MVKISTLKPYLPKDPSEFCTRPYDVIESDEERVLKKKSHSLVHIILPDGEGEQKYTNAANIVQKFKSQGVFFQENKPSIFVFRQESNTFSQQGLILGLALQDYEDGNIVKHEHTREKPLTDRTKHISALHLAPGLVWTVFKTNIAINQLIEKIKVNKPKFKFDKYGYTNILWQETDGAVIDQLQALLKNQKVYIADGHHRAASAAEYRKQKLKDLGSNAHPNSPWQYLLTYVASDDQVRILPYNRVIRKLPLDQQEFIAKIGEIYTVEPQDSAFNPAKKHEIALCCKGKWYRLTVKQKEFASEVESLDVSILQDKVLSPILGITDPRSDENIFFVGGVQDPKEMEKYVTKDGNDMFINLYPVDIRDLEKIADGGNVMPPKSTWFDPKLLSGLVMHGLIE
jgi:uncharacterized protein (DUF1015 family)